ncbi:hypothetical protein DSM104299_00160 [Baekduia alba]|uniref:hypothetical protein n=1 Tax=Baekduia alba TaxID=2997333 RepID=UPI002341700A|nr:hypothetical protein [Baekduia alba]WCB91489.1 hypothetical protein DSM104299_00160 [Baekduia alba]
MQAEISSATKAIAFVDCCGFTRFTVDHGDRAATKLHLRLRGVDYLGMSVNRAARLCTVAQPWQVRSGAEVESVRFMLRR